MSKELRAKRAYLAQENRKYPEHLIDVPKEVWPEPPAWGNARVVRVLRSRDFLVQMIEEPGNAPLRMTVNRTKIKSNGDWEDGITWDQLMRLKREAGFGGYDMIEIYPKDEDIVNVGNLRHLWIYAPGFPPRIWRGERH